MLSHELMRCISSSIIKMSRGFFFVEDPPISSTTISSNPIWVKNYENYDPTSSFENMVGLFGGIQENA